MIYHAPQDSSREGRDESRPYKIVYHLATMNSLEKRQTIATALQAFTARPLQEASLALLATLGYASDKRIDLTPATAEGFLAAFGQDRPFNRDKAEIQEWRQVEFLFQFTNDEVLTLSSGQISLLTAQVVNGALIESFVFVAIDLAGGAYSRSRLAVITREVNRLFPMPVIVLFRYGQHLALTVIRRRLHQRDATRDVLEKVTLVKDIAFAEPLRAHIDILHDFSLPVLQADFGFHDFVGLHSAWEKRLDTYQLNERFYRDIANWYFWALQHPGLIPPRAVVTEEQRSLFIIRLITRLIFCWFLREKGLIPKDLFRPSMVMEWLKDDSAGGGDYYRAILQNLFFATLNQPLGQRGFRSYNQSGGRHGNRGATGLYRYRTALRQPEKLLEQFKQIPFVNGGLFDCLDQVFRTAENRPQVRLDDFSEELGNRLCLPNEMFFGDERDVDLSQVYDDKRRKKEKVRGLIAILSRYKFTIEENTPLEQEIALDPELLGKVFENLLASYNEDTRTTARKATGSFYTPREIVNYMVDEALIAWLEACLAKTGAGEEGASLNVRLHRLFAASANELQNPFSPAETEALIAAIDRVKILDPACGSGAFPMGALHRLVDLLGKLDPNNRRWKAQQLERARQDRQLAEQMQDEVNRENALREVDARIADIELSFDSRFHALDFARKLYLIENCIYGVDIQPIACQIARLRFFIALIVDQNVDPTAPNYGIRPLPNLDTRIVAADALLPMERLQQHQFDLFDDSIRRLREDLEWVRHDHFNARTPEKKARCRQRDAELRREIAATLEASGLPGQTAALLATWSPYDQNAHADFFDPAWMFSIKEGFDVVIGNPPYVRQEKIKHLKPKLKEHYDCYTGAADLYVYFYERGLQLLKPGGAFSFISSNKWFRSAYGEKLRGWLAKQSQLLQLTISAMRRCLPRLPTRASWCCAKPSRPIARL